LDSNSNKNNNEKSPYEILGVKEGAAFEDIQKARDIKVKEAGEDLILKAKIESSFDQLLMGSLKARQSGNVSYEAVTASKKEIEKINILNASLLAMKRSILKLKFKPKIVKVDGNKKPNINNLNIKSVVRGDQKIPEISAASILAKVSRDRLIKKMSKKFKAYLWDKNVGYGTRDHLSAIKKFGITKHHRKTFKPIHNILSPK